jgi:hypothetical protein
MKIPRELPQFKDESALIVVTGKQEALFYKASRGEIKEIDTVKVPTPHFSDHEGSGHLKELMDRDIVLDLFREIKKRVKEMPLNFSRIYILAPTQIKRRIAAILPDSWRKKVRRVIPGNFYRFRKDPLFFVNKIAVAKL